MFTSAVNRDDIRVTHASQRSPFVQQSGDELLVGRDNAPQQLDRDRPIELRVVRAINGPEGAFADFLDQDELAPPVQIT
jgi:hypothetical protein